MKFFLTTLAMFSLANANAAPCSTANKAGDTCELAISTLRPTEFAVGQREVDSRSAKFSAMSAKKLDKYISENPALIVLGPAGALYVIDHTHLALALNKAGVKNMQGQVQDNLSALNDHDFWQQMQTHGWVYLYDEQGHGPLTTSQLPATLSALKDNPYRALAWAVRKQGGYQQTTTLYGDFLWGEFFRPQIKVGTSDADFAAAVSAAMALAHTPAAKNLPGWTAQDY